ncbi:MAG: DUF2461 domain-containing protein [Thiovulaceae bacterium]|nr:DUF2461 domain-containing protein [Sulfurimonadaceae bacterium]
MFKGFSQKGLEFFKELEVNNSKPWFEANKDRYEKEILAVNRAFVVEMGEHLECLVPTIKAIPKVNQSLFKIYRDIRFSKDKTPMKTHTAIFFWQGKGKRMQSSAFYLHYAPEGAFIAAGLWGFDKEMLAAYREYILDDKHREELARITENLQALGYELPQPRYKRMPKNFDAQMSHAELALFDGMYLFKRRKAEGSFFTSAIVDELFEMYEQMLPLQQWVYEMTLTKKEAV